MLIFTGFIMIIKREIVEDFFNTPKLKKKISIKELKEKYEEEYEQKVY